MNRAYSVLEIKSVDEEHRIITGIASTAETDRIGDIVESDGAEFKLPIPLLWQHNSREPIGEVFEAKVTPKGIAIKARIATITEPGKLKDRIDEAWQSLKAKLVRGLSIGFQPIEFTEIAGTFGLRFVKWLWLELSAVTIPANADATILSVKHHDTGLAASGIGARVSSSTTPGDSGIMRVVKNTSRQAKAVKKTITEQIASYEATLAAKVEERDAIMQKSADEGVTLDAEQTEAYDTLDGEIKNLNAHIARLKALEEDNKKAAKTVDGTTAKAASESRDTKQVRVEGRMPDGLEFGAMVLCKAQSYLELQKGNFVSPIDIAKKRYPDYPRIQQYLQQKANVAGGTTTDSNFASALLPAAQTLESEFLAYLRPKTIIDRFGTTQNGVRIPSLKRVPFNVKIQSQTSGASASWVGEGKGKPVTKFNTTSATLLFTKIAAISVITEELARFSRPGAEGLVRDELARSVIERMDTDFVDPAKAVSAGLNPASITNGLTALSSAGPSAANVLTDVQNLVAPFLRANYDVANLVLLMPNTLALTLSLMQNSLGQDSFKGITVDGGSLAGIPVLASNYLASGASYGNMVVALSADNIALADDGNVSVDASREASIEMSDAPANETVTPTMSAYMVSMFQTNSIAIRAEREINWKKLRADAVVYMDDVNWGSIGSPV